MKALRRIAVALPYVTFCFCSTLSPSDNQGGASETINAKVVSDSIAVTISIPERPDLSLDVIAFDITYRPVEKIGFVDSTELDGSGIDGWTGLPQGAYNVLLRTPDKKFNGIVQNLRIGNASGDTAIVSLSSGATLTGFVTSLKDGAPVSGCRMSIDGSPFATISDSTGIFTFDRLPQSLFTVTIRPGGRLLYLGAPRLTFDIEKPGCVYRTVVRVPW